MHEEPSLVMERTYDIFEKMKDGSTLWRVAVPGREAALKRLQEMAAQSHNEFHLWHLASNTLATTINTPRNENGK
jgi:hypothetical protein